MILQAALATFLTLMSLGYLIIPNSPQIVGKAIRRVHTKEKVVALTFDDGPNPPRTNELLEVLKKHEIKATFFVLGKYIQNYPDIVKQIYNDGHEIGNHSWSHNYMVFKSCNTIRKEITSTDTAIRDLGYTGVIYFRAPHGGKLINLPMVLSQQNRIHILFNVIAWDWTCPGVEKIVNNVMKSIKPGSIILLHDGDGAKDKADRSQTVKATDIIIQKLKEQNYKIVTISELLKFDSK
ncbi:polysaccharide deacetylase family protein [Candidatus Babeliales bacterium]|nr:polysaccharide deacetylase family protein [Candidatus Babeliales bacterium]